MRVKVDQTRNGLHPNELVVTLHTNEGVERLVVDRRSLKDGGIEIGWPVRSVEDWRLIELPRETQNGAWRVWVKADSLMDDEPERMRA